MWWSSLGERLPYPLPLGSALSITPGNFTSHTANRIYVKLRLGSNPDSQDVESELLIPGFRV